MKLTLIRNATLRIEYGGLIWLIDPMFAEQGANPPISNSPNDKRNPLVPLPVSAESLSTPDVLILTHLHPDHWDAPAASALLAARGAELPVFCQPGDQERIAESGFANIREIEDSCIYQGVKISRTSGQHGTGEIGQAMGRVSGFVFEAEGEPKLYLAGDTIWCDDVAEALDRHRPDVTVVHAGGARFREGDAIIMDDADVIRTTEHAPYTRIVAVHMEAINHCLTLRADLAQTVRTQGLDKRIDIPADGETLSFAPVR
ncbi:hypothetical protein CDO73_00955 [Saccharibacillus sp. O23]|uniref:MBL fold metallo-hydrolase n=1 Tax=Saccharibacillus sp. O23 TaxID=2009338 RepID=UPI000B4E3896|nr:MBL fold metallo-hydrolase [Saccharibacillus sp. O23]OWR33108.1 hypothetical protein CDO73_00955 [Saccharibacillus sp. O23]